MNAVVVYNKTRRLHRRSLRLPTRKKWAQSGYLCTTPSTAHAEADAGILGLKFGGGGSSFANMGFKSST